MFVSESPYEQTSVLKLLSPALWIAMTDKESSQQPSWDIEAVTETSTRNVCVSQNLSHAYEFEKQDKDSAEYIDVPILQEHFPKDNMLPIKGTSELLEFIHRRWCVGTAISRRAIKVKDLRLDRPVPTLFLLLLCSLIQFLHSATRLQVSAGRGKCSDSCFSTRLVWEGITWQLFVVTSQQYTAELAEENVLSDGQGYYVWHLWTKMWNGGGRDQWNLPAVTEVLVRSLHLFWRRGFYPHKRICNLQEWILFRWGVSLYMSSNRCFQAWDRAQDTVWLLRTEAGYSKSTLLYLMC